MTPGAWLGAAMILVLLLIFVAAMVRDIGWKSAGYILLAIVATVVYAALAAALLTGTLKL